jgi:regulator of sigma E protease
MQMGLDVNALLQTPNAVLAIVVVLGLAILFHETGHFLAARAFGIGVEEFAIGFGPLLWKRRWGSTVYCLRALPFGGFARIAGMEAGTQDDPHGFYSKPRWAQAMVIAGGVSMNIVLAMLFFWVVVMAYGVADPEAQAVLVMRVLPNNPAAVAGFRAGDQVIAADGNRHALLLASVKHGGLADKWGLRPGMTIEYVGGRHVALAGELAPLLTQAEGRRLVITVLDPDATSPGDFFRPIEVVVPDELSARLKPVLDDPGRAESVLAHELGVEWAPVTVPALSDYIAQRPGKPLKITVLRRGQTLNLEVTPRPRWERVAEPGPNGTVRTPHRQVGRIGVVLAPPMRRATIGEGMKSAVFGTVESVAIMVGSLRAMIKREISPELGGPIAIMAMTAEQARIGWSAVLSWGGLISANLAVVNLFPIPPFDGFYLVMIGWEALTRRRISERARNIILVAGFFIVVVVFAAFTYRDILNLLLYRTP